MDVKRLIVLLNENAQALIADIAFEPFRGNSGSASCYSHQIPISVEQPRRNIRGQILETGIVPYFRRKTLDAKIARERYFNIAVLDFTRETIYLFLIPDTGLDVFYTKTFIAPLIKRGRFIERQDSVAVDIFAELNLDTV